MDEEHRRTTHRARSTDAPRRLPAGDRLKGWKQIGEYLGVCDRTVQRWEATLGLPIHRVETAKSAVVFAGKRELDEWERSGQGFAARAALVGQKVDSGNGNRQSTAHEKWATEPAQGANGARPQASEDVDLQEWLEPALPSEVPCETESVPEDGSRHRSSRVRWLMPAVTLVGVLLVVALYSAAVLPKNGKTSPSRIAATPPPGSGAPQAAMLRLQLADGVVTTVGLATGKMATITVAGHGRYGLSLQSEVDRLSAHIYLIDKPHENDLDSLKELAVVSLKPGATTAVPVACGIVSVEWRVQASPKRPAS